MAASTLTLLSTLLSLAGTLGQDAAPPSPPPTVTTAASLDSLGFLTGRWSGQAPDGSTFYEEYGFDADGAFQSRRFEDATFSVSTDGSAVERQGGQIVSTWGPYSWRAVRLEDGLAEFEPLNAPSAFSWRRLDPDRVEVSQRWTDQAGKAQAYVLILTRIEP